MCGSALADDRRRSGTERQNVASTDHAVGTPVKHLYLVPILIKTLSIVDVLHAADQPLSLGEIASRAGVAPSSTFKILRTLEERRKIVRTEMGYKQAGALYKGITLGIGELRASNGQSSAMTESIRQAATPCGVDLLVLDNAHNGLVAIENALSFAKARVDLVIEFQNDQNAAPQVADAIARHGIPLIAVNVPHPSATYFGIDHYRSGLDAGRLLAQHALSKWNGRFVWMIGLDADSQSANPFITGAVQAASQHIPSVAPCRPLGMLTSESPNPNYRVLRQMMLERPKNEKFLIAAATPSAVFGALKAVRELARSSDVAIVGNNCAQETESELLTPLSPLIGIIHTPVEDHGRRILQLALNILRGLPAPPYNYIHYELASAENTLVKQRARPQEKHPAQRWTLESSPGTAVPAIL